MHNAVERHPMTARLKNLTIGFRADPHLLALVEAARDKINAQHRLHLNTSDVVRLCVETYAAHFRQHALTSDVYPEHIDSPLAIAAEDSPPLPPTIPSKAPAISPAKLDAALEKLHGPTKHPGSRK